MSQILVLVGVAVPRTVTVYQNSSSVTDIEVGTPKRLDLTAAQEALDAGDHTGIIVKMKNEPISFDRVKKTGHVRFDDQLRAAVKDIDSIVLTPTRTKQAGIDPKSGLLIVDNVVATAFAGSKELARESGITIRMDDGGSLWFSATPITQA